MVEKVEKSQETKIKFKLPEEGFRSPEPAVEGKEKKKKERRKKKGKEGETEAAESAEVEKGPVKPKKERRRRKKKEGEEGEGAPEGQPEGTAGEKVIFIFIITCYYLISIELIFLSHFNRKNLKKENENRNRRVL